MIPGWPYSVVAALEPGRTSWTAAAGRDPAGSRDDETEVTAAQVREVVARLIAAGHWRDGDPDILVVFDAGYDLTRLAWLLARPAGRAAGRLRSDRVMLLPAPPRRPGTNGRPARHGGELELCRPGRLARPAGHHEHPDVPVRHRPRRRLGPGAPAADRPRRLARPRRRLPVIEGTLIRLPSTTCPATATPKPLWLWSSRAGAAPPTWTAAGRRSCAASISNTCSGSSSRSSAGPAPKLRDPAAADRWTWLILAATPSSGSPAIWPTTCACPGSGPPRPAG